MRQNDVLPLVANLLSDTDLDHVKVKDVRAFINHLSPFLEKEEEEEANESSDEDLGRFVL